MGRTGCVRGGTGGSSAPPDPEHHVTRQQTGTDLRSLIAGFGAFRGEKGMNYKP